jgi:8-oxo-dGTP pyrophosphatase MutT (NUDIX family)
MTQPESDVFAKVLAGLPMERRPWVEKLGHAEFPEAGVLVALTAGAEPHVLLGRRALHLFHHPGEVAFAGGKRESSDDSPWATAIREANEEVGLAPEEIEPLGELEPLITRTGFKVYPCVARIPSSPDLIVDPSEFDSVFMPPLKIFSDASIFRLELMFDGSHNRMVPHYQVGDDNVWGVTAAILVLLANVAYDAGFDLQREWKQKP